MKNQETKTLCPLQKRDISPGECFDICIVAEGEIKPSAFVDGYLPDMNDENREKCLQCPYHWE